MKVVDKLLNSSKDAKYGNYTIRYFAPRMARISHYGVPLVDVNFGDNYGNGASFVVLKEDGISYSDKRAINDIVKKLKESKFEQLKR